jgi:hypothetical protein
MAIRGWNISYHLNVLLSSFILLSCFMLSLCTTVTRRWLSHSSHRPSPANVKSLHALPSQLVCLLFHLAATTTIVNFLLLLSSSFFFFFSSSFFFFFFFFAIPFLHIYYYVTHKQRVNASLRVRRLIYMFQALDVTGLGCSKSS